METGSGGLGWQELVIVLMLLLTSAGPAFVITGLFTGFLAFLLLVF